MAVSARDRASWQADLDALLAADLKRTSGDLNKLYSKLLGDMKTSLGDYVKEFDELSFSKRLEVDRLFLTANDLTKALGGEKALLSAHAVASGVGGYTGAWYALDQVENIAVASMGLDRRFIEALVDKPVAGRTLSQRLYRDRQKLAKAVNDFVAQGVTTGRGYAEIARRITDATEASYRRSLTIARTEGGRVRSAATQRAYEDAAKSIPGLGKRWIATLDGVTREDHRYLDGQVVAYNKDFVDMAGATASAPRQFGMAHEDINCRCSTEPIVDGEGATHRRDNTTGEMIEYQPYAEWAKAKTGETVSSKPPPKAPKVSAPKVSNVDGSITKKYGVLGAPASAEAATKGINPLWAGADNVDKYAGNCQRTASAWELRRRGVDAIPSLGSGGNIFEKGVFSWFDGITYGKEGGRWESVISARLPERAHDQVAKLIASRYPEGARGAVTVAWKGSSVGHIFNWEMYPDGARFFDAQPGILFERNNPLWGRMKSNLIVTRLDDKVANPGIANALIGREVMEEAAKKIAAINADLPTNAMIERLFERTLEAEPGSKARDALHTRLLEAQKKRDDGLKQITEIRKSVAK